VNPLFDYASGLVPVGLILFAFRRYGLVAAAGAWFAYTMVPSAAVFPAMAVVAVALFAFHTALGGKPVLDFQE
jgi:hypothetical protein